MTPKTVPCTVIDILAPPFFQQFQLPAIPQVHARNTCFPFEQHGRSLRAWLLEGLMACKRKVMLHLQTKRAIYLTKTPCQLNCKLHDIFNQCLYTWNLTIAIAQVQEYSHSEKCLEKLCIFVFCCEGKILLTLFGDHISCQLAPA